MPRIATLLAWTTLVLLAPSVSIAQIGGSGSIQGTVLDSSNAAAAGRDGHRDERRHGHRDGQADDGCGRLRADAAAPGRVSRHGDARRLPDVRPRRPSSSTALSVVGLNVTLAGRRRQAGSRRHRGGAAARDGRRAARPDDSQRGLHRAAARDEHRRPARSDGVHVPDAGRAVDRTLGQRDGRPGFHDRHVRGRHPDHQRRRAG